MADDVTPDSSPDPSDPSASPDPSPVSDVADSSGRTIDNVYGELMRRQTKTDEALNQLLALMSAQQSRPAEPVKPGGWDQYTDEQLGQLAQSGSWDAQAAHTERVATRRVQTEMGNRQRQDLVSAQLQGLYSRYPVLQDASHPLTQAALRAKSVLVSSGAHPQAPATDLEAIKMAIVDNPHLVATGATPSQPPPARRVDVTPQQTMDGSTTRQSRPQGKAVKVDPRVAAIAARMGVDPVKAMERFQERQNDGRSSVSPQVMTIVREQGNA